MTDAATPDRGNIVTATAEAEDGDIEASAVLDASPERVFRALTSHEICNWWVRPGVFDTREWSGEVREGGRWTAAGVGGGRPYQLEGEFVTIDGPWRLTQSWKPVGAPVDPSLLTYELEPLESGVLMTLHHTGLPNAEVCENTRAGWVTSLARLQEILRAEKG